MTPSTLFSLSQVSFKIGEKSILNSIAFQVFQNELLCITGPSGAGKTSLIRLLNGLQSPSSGTLLFHGKTLSEMDFTLLRKKVGMVFQNPVILEGSVRDNLSLANRWAQSESGFQDTDLMLILDKVGLSAIPLEQNASDLSGGEQQRLNLARVLLNQPEVLLLDEPTANLDGKQADKILDLVRDLTQSYALTTVMISHDEARVRQYGDRILYMDQGKFVSS